MSSATILHSQFSGKNKKKYCKMMSAEIFTQYAERKQIYLGSKHCTACNVIYLVISLIRFSDITNLFMFSDITNSIF